MVCPNCNDSSQRFNPQKHLFVYIEGAATLQKLLRTNTFADDFVTGRECDNCGTISDTTKTWRLTNAPDILVIQLVRFTKSGSKNTAKVGLGKYLDLSPFIINKTLAKYRLASLIDHRGSQVSGHYVCVALNEKGKWKKMDDNTVTDVESFRGAIDLRGDWTSYLLFYHRIECHGGAKTGNN